jgi:cytochrome c oxidase assembly protein subunit 11
MDRNTRTVVMSLAVVASMTGLAYASVPFYRWFCQVTGFDGTPARAETIPGPDGIVDRVIRVRFDANVAPGLTWDFRPMDAHIDIRVGDVGITAYEAKNTGRKPTRGHATFNVTPEKAAKYFTKVACFCFTDQPMAPHEKREMPLNFFIDPAIMNDRLVDDIDEITLSYTFFPQEVQAADAAGEPAAARN